MSARSIREFGLGALGLVVAAGIVALVLSQLRLAPPLERSAIGLDGLAALLDAENQPARTFAGGSTLETEAIGLRILPIFEREVDGFTFSPVAFGEGAYLNAPVRPITRSTVTAKARAAPTLIVLSKWSDGVRRSGLAHPDFLLSRPDRTAVAVYDDLGTDDAEQPDTEAQPKAPADRPASDGDARADGADASTDDPDAQTYRPITLPMRLPADPDTQTLQTLSAPQFGSITLRAPQFMRLDESCNPLIGTVDQALLAVCRLKDTRFWVLSDPDVLNNHGLHLGENAAVALALIADLSASGEVLIDYSTILWSEADDRRSWWEFLRALQPPFLWFWIAALTLFSLAFWRSLVRAEPVRSLFEEGHRGARQTVVAAQARLMRNTGRDGALLRALSRQRARALCDLLLGRDAGSETRRTRMLEFVARRDEDLGARLAAALKAADAAEDRLAVDQAISLLTQLESAYEEARLLA